MNNIPLKLRDPNGKAWEGCLVEQGIPVKPMDPEQVQDIVLLDEQGNPVQCCIEHDGRDENGKTVWIRLTTVADIPQGAVRNYQLVCSPEKKDVSDGLNILKRGDGWSIKTSFYQLDVTGNTGIKLYCNDREMVSGDVSFQLWPDARSIIGAGGGTSRLAFFEGQGWSIEEQTDKRCLLILKGRVPKYAPYTSDPNDFDPIAQFDCELELLVTSLSPIIRYRWRIENHTVWQTYLERYTLVLPLAQKSRITDGESSGDGKYLRWIEAETPGGVFAMSANYVDVLGAGAGINAERRENLGDMSAQQVGEHTGDGIFEPHRYLAAEQDNGKGLDIVSGGVNPPHDGCMWAENPEVHRLFYRGMGRTFDGAILVNGKPGRIQQELQRIYFELPPDHYSQTGVLPENGDSVDFGQFKDKVFACAEWMLKRQWRGTLWWGEWWREWDEYRKQGVESTANGNNPLGPLFHYWRTGDARFIDCAKRAMEFAYDVQLNKQRTGIAPFFHSRRYLIDQMEWVHMRYQRIDGPMKTAHFLGDRRLRTRLIDARRKYAEALVCPNGAPGYAEGGAFGKRVPAGADCTNFGEVLAICYRETGEEHFLDKARKMANWTLRFMKTWDWDEYIGNSYGWHFLMRGILQTYKLTGNRRYRDWYVDMARKNLTYPLEEMEFRCWMDWLLVEAEKMSGEKWFIDEIARRTDAVLQNQLPDGSVWKTCSYPWSKWPSLWQTLYDQKTVVAYVPVLTARQKFLNENPE